MVPGQNNSSDGDHVRRIAMWSGPRNISTAMMRSWDARADTVVCDEPLYAHYLRETGREHPGAAEIIAHHEPDADRVVTFLTGPSPDGCAIFYQKHMAHHLLPTVDRSFLDRLINVFLVRDPDAMLVSLARVLPDPTPEETGLPQQVELVRQLRSDSDVSPIVIVANDVLTDPEAMLRSLCAAIDVPFDPAMLSWSPGPRPTDGIWARHWYASVEASTQFGPPRPPVDGPPSHLREVAAVCRACYDELITHRLAPAPPSDRRS